MAIHIGLGNMAGGKYLDALKNKSYNANVFSNGIQLLPRAGRTQVYSGTLIGAGVCGGGNHCRGDPAVLVSAHQQETGSDG